ncbi:predicted protein [Phaeodactylum tricornutum CCAP 1055/1]|uniref:Uncharacterized protein n=1 Tax=Phaeodactylum tricornutum (strain CCAP 1055/1) TaxID=556484 RepID=B7GAZ9_PHATC|nr:predicted protein [Phaeodactylum tricornutum CCAP 1055/1]EEC44030.1 predicted protein [Phaeodactylum tricornutum CCAP 1055/1]|eukprot:XP_002184281.1 predicted protein [Phaeodactylum tricornutum CCAP 1055/1]
MKQYLLERTTAWLTTWSLILLVAVAQKDVHPDVVAVVDVAGGVQPTPLWASSYSDGENCYCLPSLDSAFGNFVVETPLGWLTMQELCDLLGTGPGRLGQYLYNDIQCGNGPPNADENEFLCPGRTDIGETGCGQIGPKWNVDNAYLADAGPPRLPLLPEDVQPETVAVIDVVGGVTLNGRLNTFGMDDDSASLRGTWTWVPVWKEDRCTMTYSAGVDHLIMQEMRMPVLEELIPLFPWTCCDEMPHHDASPLYNTQLGPEGYGQIGPRWNFDVTKSLPPGSAPMALPSSLAAVAVLVPMLPGVGVITGLLFCVLNWHIFDLVRCHQGVW